METLEFVEQPVLEEEYEKYLEAMKVVSKIFGTTDTEVRKDVENW